MLAKVNELNQEAFFAYFYIFNDNGRSYVQARENYFLSNCYLSTRNGSNIDIDWGGLCVALCLSFSKEIDG